MCKSILGFRITMRCMKGWLWLLSHGDGDDEDGSRSLQHLSCGGDESLLQVFPLKPFRRWGFCELWFLCMFNIWSNHTRWKVLDKEDPTPHHTEGRYGRVLLYQWLLKLHTPCIWKFFLWLDPQMLKEICPRGNNNIVIIIFLIHDNVYIPC
jgi:hypothetical protein